MSVATGEGSPAGLKLFILGSERSGTSIAYFAAREVLSLEGRGEGHVFPIFNRVNHQYYLYTQQFVRREGTLAAELRPDPFTLHIQTFVRQFYDGIYGQRGFVDKTPGPESIRSAPLIAGTFPDARIMLMRRSGIEVVRSYVRKFGTDFAVSCQVWVNCMVGLEVLRANGPHLLEVDQFDLTNNPELTGQRIAEHVGMPDRAPTLARFFTERRVEQSSAHDWRERMTLARTGWSEAEQATFRDICGPTMDTFEYPM